MACSRNFECSWANIKRKTAAMLQDVPNFVGTCTCGGPQCAVLWQFKAKFIHKACLCHVSFLVGNFGFVKRIVHKVPE